MKVQLAEWIRKALYFAAQSRLDFSLGLSDFARQSIGRELRKVRMAERVCAYLHSSGGKLMKLFPR